MPPSSHHCVSGHHCIWQQVQCKFLAGGSQQLQYKLQVASSVIKTQLSSLHPQLPPSPMIVSKVEKDGWMGSSESRGSAWCCHLQQAAGSTALSYATSTVPSRGTDARPSCRLMCPTLPQSSYSIHWHRSRTSLKLIIVDCR